jgi:hypothetical protein
MERINLAQEGIIEDSCEHCNEPSSAINCWEILE